MLPCSEVEWSLAESGAAQWEPVSLDTLRDHLHLTDTAQDDLLQLYATAAREYVETLTNRCLAARTLLYSRRGFPTDRDFFELPRTPARAITSIASTSTAGVTTTLATSVYALGTAQHPPRVYLKLGQSWPGDVADLPASVVVTYTAGAATPAAVERREILAILWLAAWWFEQRVPVTLGNTPAEIPTHLEAIISNLTVHRAYP